MVGERLRGCEMILHDVIDEMGYMDGNCICGKIWSNWGKGIYHTVAMVEGREERIYGRDIVSKSNSRSFHSWKRNLGTEKKPCV